MKGSEFWIPDLGLIEVFFFFVFWPPPLPFFSFFLSLPVQCSVQCARPIEASIKRIGCKVSAHSAFRLIRWRCPSVQSNHLVVLIGLCCSEMPAFVRVGVSELPNRTIHPSIGYDHLHARASVDGAALP